jgi:hypothetical protein
MQLSFCSTKIYPLTPIKEQGLSMKNVVLAGLFVFAAMPAASFASTWMPVTEGTALSGKVHAVKMSKKLLTVEKCRSFAEKSESVVGFTLDTAKGTCTTYKSVRGRPTRDGAVSQQKA